MLRIEDHRVWRAHVRADHVWVLAFATGTGFERAPKAALFGGQRWARLLRGSLRHELGVTNRMLGTGR